MMVSIKKEYRYDLRGRIYTGRRGPKQIIPILFFFLFLINVARAETERVIFVYWSAEIQGLSVDIQAVEHLRFLASKTNNPDASKITTVLYFDPFLEDTGGFKTPVREVYLNGVYDGALSERFLEEKNFGDGAFFGEALTFASQFEAQERVGLFAGHGSSWMPKGGKEYDELAWAELSPFQRLLGVLVQPVSFGYDAGGGVEDNLTVFELRDAFLSLPESKRRFNLIWYYACLMNNLEYLFEHRHFVDWVVAGDAALSSTIYLNPLFTIREDESIRELATEIARSNFNASTPDQTNYIVSDISKVEAVVDALVPLKDLVLELGREGKLTSQDIDELQHESRILAENKKLDYDVDLYRFLNILHTKVPAHEALSQVIARAMSAIKEMIIFSPYDDLQDLIGGMKAWMEANAGEVSQDILDLWLHDERLGRGRDFYFRDVEGHREPNLTSAVFNERVWGKEPLNSRNKYTKGSMETFNVAHVFRSHFRGEFSPKEYLSFFYPSPEKVSQTFKMDKSPARTPDVPNPFAKSTSPIQFENEIEARALKFYKRLEFSQRTGWWDVIHHRLPENRLRWLKEYEGSDEGRRAQEQRKKFNDPYY